MWRKIHIQFNRSKWSIFQVMILITGAHKAFALYKAIEEGVNHMWTVSAFQQHPKTLMLCDEDATLELRVKTVKYFKVKWLCLYYFYRFQLFHSLARISQIWWKYFTFSLWECTHSIKIAFHTRTVAVNQDINHNIEKLINKFYFYHNNFTINHWP